MKSPVDKAEPARRKAELAATTNLQFVDFGCGSGHSINFADSIVPGNGFGIDIAEAAVETCRAKGFAAELGDVLDFDQRSIALATFGVNLLQELPGRTAFERALSNMVRAARNFTVVQHGYFDADPELALQGQHIEANFTKKIQFKPTIADYVHFAQRQRTSLNLSGMAIFTSGKAEVSALTLGTPAETDLLAGVPRTMRVVFGRKDVSRFRAALEKVGSGKGVFVWEQD